MPKISTELKIHNTYLEFDNPAGKTFDVAPSGKVRLYGNAAGTAILMSANGGAYGVVESSGGLGDSLTLGAGGAMLSGNATGEITALGTSDTPFRAGRGLPLGQPPGIITLADGGAGALTGTYQYAYTETDIDGETVLSASASIAVTSKQIQVTIPLKRRGAHVRHLYRTAAGGSAFFLLLNLEAGDGWAQTIYVDNNLDAVLQIAAPTTDTTAIYELVVRAGVKYFATHPDQGTGAADLTLVTGDPATGGAYGIDNYGPYFGRVARGSAMGLHVTGLNANAINCLWVSDTFDGAAAVETFRVDADGKTRIIVAQPLTDAEPNALLVNATMPTTITATRSGISATITSAGASSQQQNGMALSFEAGYTGNQTCNGFVITNAVATTATCVGFQGTAAAGTRACGVLGKATGGTTRIGGFFGLSTDMDTVTGEAGALLCSNGAIASRIFGAFDGTTLAFEVRDAGAVSARGVGSGSFVQTLLDSLVNVGAPLGGLQGRGTEGAGGANLRVTGAGNNVFWGHSNSEYLCTLGANSGGAQPFIGLYCYHGATSSTQRYASGTNIPVRLQSSTAGMFSIANAAAGTVDTDITWTDRLKVGPTGRLFATAPNSAPTDSDIGTSQITWYLDEAGATLKIRVRQSDGTTLKLASIALV